MSSSGEVNGVSQDNCTYDGNRLDPVVFDIYRTERPLSKEKLKAIRAPVSLDNVEYGVCE